MKLFVRLLVFLVLLATPAMASQNSLVLPNTGTLSGLTLVNSTNSAFNTLITNSAGSSAPSTTYSDQFWANTSSNLFNFTPDGTHWYSLGAFGNSTWQAISDGVPDDAVTSTGSANAYVVTYSPAPAAMVTGHIYKFITNFSNTGSSTVNVNTIGAVTLKKFGGTNLSSGDLGNGQVVTCVYDGTYCQITSQTATTNSGTVTNVATGTGLTGGPITSTGTIGLATIASDTILANTSGGTAAPASTGLDSTLNINGSSKLAVTTATTSQLGAVKPDGTTITVSGGVISATGSSGVVLLATINCTSGSPCSTVTFTSTYITSTYNKYVIEYDNAYSNQVGGGTPSLGLQISTNNGSSWITVNYQGSASCISSTVLCIGGNVGTTTTATTPMQGTIKLSNPSVSAQANFFLEADGNGGNLLSQQAGSNVSTSPFNAIKIFDAGAANTFYGNFHLYGLSGT